MNLLPVNWEMDTRAEAGPVNQGGYLMQNSGLRPPYGPAGPHSFHQSSRWPTLYHGTKSGLQGRAPTQRTGGLLIAF